MSSDANDQANGERTWRILLIGMAIAGTFFFLGAVPLIFGGHGDWSSVLLQTLLGGLAAAITSWFLESIRGKSTPAWWSAAPASRPVMRALKLGALTALIVLGVTFLLPLNVPDGASFNAAITLALCLGAWSALITWVGFNIRHRA